MITRTMNRIVRVDRRNLLWLLLLFVALQLRLLTQRELHVVRSVHSRCATPTVFVTVKICATVRTIVGSIDTGIAREGAGLLLQLLR